MNVGGVTQRFVYYYFKATDALTSAKALTLSKTSVGGALSLRFARLRRCPRKLQRFPPYSRSGMERIFILMLPDAALIRRTSCSAPAQRWVLIVSQLASVRAFTGDPQARRYTSGCKFQQQDYFFKLLRAAEL